MSPDHSFDLAGRVCVITGGTRGVGLAVARELGGRGGEVVLSYASDTAVAEAAVGELDEAGVKALAVRADAGTAEGARTLFDAVADRHGGLDVFVHSAVTFRPAPTLAADPERTAREHAVALGPLLHGTARLVELIRPGTGRIVAISSPSGRVVVPGQVSLGTAKAAVESLVRYLAVDLAATGVTVNAVAPGKLDKGVPAPGREAEIAARITARTPAGRLTTPADVARVVALLCTREAGWITGNVLTADGGFALQT